MEEFQFQIVIAGPGARPPYRDVVEHVYGVGADVDTEGDSHPASRTDWTWLYMSLRPAGDMPDVVISMADGEIESMIVCSNDEVLALRTAGFLASETGGTLLG